MSNILSSLLWMFKAVFKFHHSLQLLNCLENKLIWSFEYYSLFLTNGVLLETAGNPETWKHTTSVWLLQFCAKNVGNPALNTRPTILNHFFVHFYFFRDGFVKSLISNNYCQNVRVRMKCNHLMQREILLLIQNKREKMPLK
jgi:hypothetical protein